MAIAKGSILTLSGFPYNNCLSIKPPMPKTEVIEITSLADGSKTYDVGIEDPGTLEFELTYTQALYNTLHGFKGGNEAFTVEYPDGLEVTGVVFVQSVETDLKAGSNNVVIKVVGQISGDVTVTPPGP